MRVRRVMLLLAGIMVLVACHRDARAESRPPDESVLILAAASTTDAVEEIGRMFEREHPVTTVHASFGASSTLAKQILAGARANLFLAASTDWADRVAEQGLVARRCDLLSSRLVVIVAAGSSISIDRPDELVGKEIRRLALADPVAVPAGVYAREALEKLGLWEKLAERVAAGADVRQALQFVATGAAEAGIVYASDVTSEPRVRIACELPAEMSDSIRYPLVLLKDSGRAAESFYEYLSSPAAARIFARHGFVTLADGNQADETAGPAEAPAAAHGRWLSRDEWLALRLSLLVGVCAVLASLPLAVVTGYLLARGNWRGKWLVELLVNLPLVLPPVVTGFLLLILFAPHGPIGGLLESWFGLRIVFSWFGAAIAAAVVSFPLMVRSIRLAFQSVDPRLAMAARSLGAGPWDAFWSVSLPLARSGVLAGSVLAFARSLGEFGATIMVAGNIVGETQTIPLAIFTAANRPGGESQVWRLVLISIALAAAALAVSEWLERRHAARDAT